MPSAVQLSAVMGSQLTQVAPAAPQVAKDRVSHALPVQQPPGHEFASQMQVPEEQLWPGPQAAPVPQRHSPLAQWSALLSSQAVHTAPVAPQLASDGASQLFPRQQPVVHELASHTQAPFSQRSPGSQAGPPPHWQLPSIEQLSASTGLHGTHAAPA